MDKKKAYDRRGKFSKKPEDLQLVSIRECLRYENTFKRFKRNKNNFSCDRCNAYLDRMNEGD